MQGVPLEQTPLWARDHTYASANLVEMLGSAGLSAKVLPLDVVARSGESSGSLDPRPPQRPRRRRLRRQNRS